MRRLRDGGYLDNRRGSGWDPFFIFPVIRGGCIRKSKILFVTSILKYFSWESCSGNNLFLIVKKIFPVIHPPIPRAQQTSMPPWAVDEGAGPSLTLVHTAQKSLQSFVHLDSLTFIL